MKKRFKKFVLIIFIIIGMVIIGIAFARYLATVNGNLQAQVANWSLNVSVNGNTNQNFEVDLADTRLNNDSNQVEGGYIAPGTRGAFDIVVNASGSDSLLVYNIDINTTNIPKNLHFYVDSNMKTEIFYSNKKFGYEGCIGYRDENKTQTHTVYWDWPFESGETEAEIEENDEDDSLWIGEEILLSLNITGTQVKAEPTYLAKTAELGDYVDYVDGEGNTIKCVVLYNDSTYGLQVVSVEPVRSVTLGYGDQKVTGNSSLEKAQKSYNRAVVTLNEYAMDYLNTNLAYNARCVGSMANNKDFPNNLSASQKKQQMYIVDPKYNYIPNYYSNMAYKSDYNYLYEDKNRLTQINKIKFTDTTFGSNYWLASHNVYVDSYQAYFSFDYCNTNGEIQQYAPWIIYSDGRTAATNPTFAFRPVFYLKQNVKVSDGEGSENFPYQLINY